MEPVVVLAPLDTALCMLQHSLGDIGSYDITCLWEPFPQLPAHHTELRATAVLFTPASAQDPDQDEFDKAGVNESADREEALQPKEVPKQKQISRGFPRSHQAYI